MPIKCSCCTRLKVFFTGEFGDDCCPWGNLEDFKEGIAQFTSKRASKLFLTVKDASVEGNSSNNSNNSNSGNNRKTRKNNKKKNKNKDTAICLQVMLVLKAEALLTWI